MPRPEEPDIPPCAQLQVLGGRVGELERRLDEHNRIQNTHLAGIETKLTDLFKANADGREERSKQIGDLRTDVVERFNKILLTALAVGIPVMASLIYLILNQALKTP